MTTPAATIASERHCCAVGRGARVARSTTTARAAATSARPNATTHGSRSRSASRVAGSENEKPITPIVPRSTPGPRRTRHGCVTRGTVVALLPLLMVDDNTDQRVIEDVRTAARALPPGSRLPSVRELMARHRASPVTVQRAIARLAQEGLVVPRPGRGTFVAPRPVGTAADDPPDLS